MISVEALDLVELGSMIQIPCRQLPRWFDPQEITRHLSSLKVERQNFTQKLLSSYFHFFSHIFSIIASLFFNHNNNVLRYTYILQ